VSDAATAGASFSSPGSPDGISAKEDKASFLSSPPPSLLSRRVETLENIGDLDYLTHIVFRMYECFDVPAADPNRFRVEILLSTGVGLDPFKQNVIAEFDAAAAEANRREKQSASPLNRTRAEETKRDKDREKTGLQRAGGSDAARLPLLRQFPIHNDRAHDAVRVAGTSGAKKTPARTEPELKTELKTDERAEYLTLNDLESYLWKFRKNRLAQPGGGGGSGGNTTDWASPRKESADPGTPAKPQKSGLGVGGPKRSVKKKTKKKGSDSESD
jgi:inositol hexakisphosphate/diphosphoinositol-pentakisphosphate kinase